MKKSLIFLLSLVLISSLSAAVQLPLTGVEGDFNLYDRYGNKIDVMDAGPYAEEGYIILTEKGASFTCPYGEIHLGADTLFTILSLDETAPVLYLVDGKANFISYDDFYIEIYTPVSLVAFDKKGEYVVETTTNKENIYNLSRGRMMVLNGLSGNSSVLENLTYIEMLNGGHILPVSYNLYESISILHDNAPAKVPSMPSVKIDAKLFDVEEEAFIEEMIEEPAIEEAQAPVPQKAEIVAYTDLKKTEPDKPVISVSAELIDIPEPPVPTAPILTVDYTRPSKPELAVKIQTMITPEVPSEPVVSASFQSLSDTVPSAPVFLEPESIFVNKLQAPSVTITDTIPSAPSVTSSIGIEKKTI